LAILQAKGFVLSRPGDAVALIFLILIDIQGK
jgi:hypothetical protein